MIKNIIFDFGGVILKHKATLVEDILSTMFPDAKDKALQIWNTYDLLLKTGKKTSDDLITELKNTLQTESTFGQLKKQWEDLYKQEASNVNWELLEFIKTLKKKYKVYLFTDTIDIHDEFNKTRGIYEKFEKVFRSFKEGVAKVEGKSAFLYLLKKIKTRPSECVFVDDVGKYVDFAKEVGSKGILYKNNEDFKKKLAKVL